MSLLTGWFSLRLEPALLERMRTCKRRDGIPMAEQVRRALAMWLDDREWRVYHRDRRS